MGKGSKRRPRSRYCSREEFDQKMDSIFGNKPAESKGGTYIWDEQKQKFIHEDDWVPSENPNKSKYDMPDVYYKGGGWPTQDIKMAERKKKGLQEDLFFTSLNSKKKQLKKRREQQNEQVEEFRDKLNKKGKERFDKERKQSEKQVERMKTHPKRKELFDKL